MTGSMVSSLFAADEARRQERIASAWRAYYGEAPRPLKTARGEPDDNVTLNYARLVVDQGVSFLMGRGPTFEVDDERAGAWLDAVWEANHRAALLHHLALNGAIAGQAFLDISVPAKGLPRLTATDPQAVTIRHEPDDVDGAVGIEVAWHGIDPITGRPVARRRLMERKGAGWSIRDEESVGDSALWRLVSSSRWPYPWPPLAWCRNLPAPNSLWGVSDLEPDILGVCRSMDFVLSNMARILRYHAHPRTIGTGFVADTIGGSVDDITVLPSPEARIYNLEMQGDLGSSVELYRRLKEAFHELARSPQVAAGHAEGLGQSSGVALQVLYQPLVEKTRTKQMLYGDLLAATSRRLLEIGGFGPAVSVRVHWPALLPVDPRAEAETALLHQQLGADPAMLRQRLGIDTGPV